MNQLLQWIGTFASIISVPLAIYFYFKTMDGKYEKVRKELIDLFSNYIGSGNKLTYFYLSSVINAKVRRAYIWKRIRGRIRRTAKHGIFEKGWNNWF